MLRIECHGDFSKTKNFLKSLQKHRLLGKLAKYGERGVDALRSATPVDTGLTANSWYYDIEVTDDKVSLVWKNSNVQKGWANVALLIQYGHGTRNGGYVQGIDYINPAMAPIFEEIADSVWKEITTL